MFGGGAPIIAIALNMFIASIACLVALCCWFAYKAASKAAVKKTPRLKLQSNASIQNQETGR